ncbi:D-alanyl-D-alanine carboxypeptidase [Paenibacillus tianmuensis]|uniref:D-alanyl-D-alanine carboxypeptidase n=1 Tax=Paenibacillus tianmuensis TaxID=624147 RepID=A0A1G4S9E7_9BACL|nr:VanY-A/VanY-F/VanY-M family D-Ala-D-Ala carboxypeptidase [Paenibacillus tianmuensis]SCW65686.1 D-alanyl-D-alanine carboxypeptidase [Paenibacillus tianmuensis]
MKKWFFLLVILLPLGCEAIQQEPQVVIGEYSKAGDQAQEAVSQTKHQTKAQTIKVTKSQIYQGNLLLVNKQYPVRQEGVTADVANLFQHKELVKGYGLLDKTIRLSQGVAQKFQTMVDAAAKEGVRHFMISSGYRDNQEQGRLYKSMGADYALPAGYSEHNLGLSLDIGSTQTEMNRAPEGKWLQKNAWAYGFILRYPKDKTEITGIQYEPWHFRYVGLPHSAIMQEKNFTLEQYLDFLKEQKTISTTVEGKAYEVSYYPVSGNTSIPVPAGRRYERSGNNMDGVIVTLLP